MELASPMALQAAMSLLLTQSGEDTSITPPQLQETGEDASGLATQAMSSLWAPASWAQPITGGLSSEHLVIPHTAVLLQLSDAGIDQHAGL